MKKHLALVLLLAGSAAAQAPAASKKAIVEADVLLVGCAPKFRCGRAARMQPVALRITKVDSGPLKVGDTPVMDVLACYEGPLLVGNDGLAELDPKQIRRGSKIKVELDVDASGTSATTDKIAVTKL